MRRVLHVGPCNTPGGMATVMTTLADHPPNGWEASLLSSHSEGGILGKWRAYRRARRELNRRCTDASQRPDVVHVHVASDWSWRRKARLIAVARRHGVAVVVHLHSGRFEAWLEAGGPRRSGVVKKALSSPRVEGVVLSEAWRARLEGHLGRLTVIGNPLPATTAGSQQHREKNHLLLLGRNDPVKGHAFALRVAERLRTTHPDLRLTMTGWEQEDIPWVESPGWVSNEQKVSLMARASVLLVPSAYEGQPMVALEALSTGLPVCASDRVQGLPDTVVQASYGDVDAWVSRLSEVLEQPESSEALVKSVASHAVDEVQKQWSSLYDSL